MNNVPLEDEEQALVVHYCDIKGYPRFRVPNETYTKSWNQKRKNKVLGVSSGVPDLFVIANGQLKAIEMKRIKGSVTSQSQKQWIEKLNNVGVPAKVCRGADEAIDFIENGGLQWREQEQAVKKQPKRIKLNTEKVFIQKLGQKGEGTVRTVGLPVRLLAQTV